MAAVNYDPGPPEEFEALFAGVPGPPVRDRFWSDWGPVFYRGRLDGSARLLCVASDPGPTERIAGRTLVGDAGQRVQGFLAKLGLTRSYVCVNAFAYALFPSQADSAPEMLRDEAQARWRNAFYDAVLTPRVQAIVAFGAVAQEAVSQWDHGDRPPVVEVPHPSSRDERGLVRAWREAVTSLRRVVTPDPDGDATIPNYGDTFAERDYAAIPRTDLPFGVPAFLGDDAFWRTGNPPRSSSVRRPQPDDRRTLIWVAPPSR